MPTPPKPNESKESFLSRCIAYMHKHHTEKKDSQKAATCYSMWEAAHPGGKASKK